MRIVDFRLLIFLIKNLLKFEITVYINKYNYIN